MTNTPDLILRPAAARGHADHGWLKSAHSFSFADYHDPAQMGFRALRVINEDHVAGGAGFPPHPHRDMEIITYVLSGAVAHKDSTGGEGLLKPFRETGEVQAMTAGTGVTHSEFNPSPTDELHLLQIWLLPNYDRGRRDVPAQYRQHQGVLPHNSLTWLATNDDTHATATGAALIHSDARLAAGQLEAGASLTAPLALGHGWLQLARGALTVNGVAMQPGDGLAITATPDLTLQASENAEFLLFDLG